MRLNRISKYQELTNRRAGACAIARTVLSVHPLSERSDLTCEFDVVNNEDPIDSGITRGYGERGHVGRVSFVLNH